MKTKVNNHQMEAKCRIHQPKQQSTDKICANHHNESEKHKSSKPTKGYNT
jgi:hypothetical protein